MSFHPEQVLEVAGGLFGFADDTRFLLLEVPAARPIVFLQSIQSPDLCFIGLPAQVVDPDYRLRLTQRDRQLLGFPNSAPRIGRDVLCIALLTIGEDGTTANLQAPVVVDIRRHRARQVILEAEYSFQHPFAIPECELVC